METPSRKIHSGGFYAKSEAECVPLERQTDLLHSFITQKMLLRNMLQAAILLYPPGRRIVNL